MPKRASGKWYGQAIFELALERKALEDCLGGLERIVELSRDDLLLALLENPKVPFEAKDNLLREKLQALHPLTVNLALLLVHKEDLRLAEDILKHYRLLLDGHRGIERGQLTTALPLEERHQEILSKRIGQILGRKVTLDLQVDPSILGGFIARVGDTVVDGSVRQNLEMLKKNLMEVRGS